MTYNPHYVNLDSTSVPRHPLLTSMLLSFSIPPLDLSIPHPVLTSDYSPLGRATISSCFVLGILLTFLCSATTCDDSRDATDFPLSHLQKVKP